jgi:hypothetical protein
MTKHNLFTLVGKTVSIEGRHGVVISAPVSADNVAGTVTGSIDVCWKVGEAMGEEVETFNLFDLPDSFEVLSPSVTHAT